MGLFEEKLAEIIGEIGEDEDIKEKILDVLREDFDFSEPVQDALQNDDRAKKAVIKIIIGVLENIDSDDVSDNLSEKIKDAADFDDLVQELMKDQEIKNKLRDKIRELVESEIDSWDPNDDDNLKETIIEAVSIDSDAVKEIISDDESIQKKKKEKIRELVIEQIDNLDVDNFNLDKDDIIGNEEVREFAQTDPEVKQKKKEKILGLITEIIDNLAGDDLDVSDAIKSQIDISSLITEPGMREAILAKVRETLTGEYVERIFSSQSDTIEKILVQSPIFQDTFNAIFAEMSRDGRLQKLLQEAIASFIENDSEGSSIVARSFTETLTKRFVDGLIEVAFAPKRI